MSLMDSASIGLALLSGLVILLRFAVQSISLDRIRQFCLKIASAHEKANHWLLKKGLLHIPGAHLVTSLRGWIYAESVLFASITLSISAYLSLPAAAVTVFCGCIAGAIVFILSFRQEAENGMDAIRSALPLASFLMSLMLEAGMGSPAALQEVVGALPPGPLVRELADISRSRMLGMSRENAIERSRGRVPLDDYRSFLNLIQQGERLGIALSQGLRELSSRMMESQGHRAETIAQKAAVKLLFPLVVFIFPSVFLIILSPVILHLWEMMGR